MSIAPAVLLAMVALAAHASLADAPPAAPKGRRRSAKRSSARRAPTRSTPRAASRPSTAKRGNDTIFGGRGNESLYGGEGNDRLYGGPGDDRLRGGAADDLLSGGFGADSLDGEAGSDYARGDATIDYIGDSGTGGTDTLSFATGATPGFPNRGQSRFRRLSRHGADGRGVFIEARQGLRQRRPGTGRRRRRPTPLEGQPRAEKETFESFETVIGTPFSDYIVGTANAETIYGGGGADVILGEGGEDHIFGGADGDYCDEDAGTLDSLRVQRHCKGSRSA